MSLLNDMLRDLVKQQKVIATPVVCSHDILQDTQLFKNRMSHWLTSAIIFAVVFVLVLAFKYFFTSVQLSRHLPSSPIASQQVTAKDVLPKPQQSSLPEHEAASVEPAVSVAAINIPQDVALQASVAAKSVANGADLDEQLQRDIADLLLQANRALTQDKLTSPIEDNAYSYFQTIAKISPNHPQVKIGLELIAARYLEKAREQLSLGNLQQAEISRQRAKFVSPEYFRDYDLRDTEKSLLQDTGNSTMLGMQPLSSSVATTLPQTETIKPFEVAEVSSLNVVPNAAWKDEQLAIQADELMRKGKLTEAQQLLKNFVVSESKPIRSTALLGDLYFQQGNAQALEVLMTTASYLPAQDRAKLHAQMLAVQGDEAAAITELEQQLTAAENNEQYRAFLASLYHKTGRYQQSVVSYQRLLNSYGEKPAYWLGLALAFDGLLQNKNALQAYQRLLHFPQLQEQVRDYINQRISALRDE